MSRHVLSQESRLALMSSSGRLSGFAGSGAHLAHSVGSGTVASAGKTYMFSGKAAWNAFRVMNFTNAAPPLGLAAPASTPAYSVCLKQVSSSALVVGLEPPSGTVNGGEDA